MKSVAAFLVASFVTSSCALVLREGSFRRKDAENIAAEKTAVSSSKELNKDTEDGGDSFKFGGLPYELVRNPMNWFQAEEYCKGRGGHLVTVASSDVNEWLTQQLKKRGVKKAWIGYNDPEKKGVWQWMNPGGRCKGFTNWEQGKTDRMLDEYCAQLNHDGTWVEHGCNKELPLICELDSANIELCPQGWMLPRSNVQCNTFSTETYTLDSERGCIGWANTDLDTCKRYCETNALPPGCKPQGENMCKYVIWTKNKRWCQLARSCTEEPQDEGTVKITMEYIRNI